MKIYSIKKQMTTNGELILKSLPFKQGETVEVTIQSRDVTPTSAPAADLKGKVIEYLDPTDPVAKDEWDAIK